MSWQTVSLLLPLAALLVIFGLLLGSAWTMQALQPKLRHQAEERRRLNEQWAEVRAARRRRGRCPRCAVTLSECDWYPEEPPDEDR